MADKGNYHWGVGRRKTAVARVRIREGSGHIIVNGKQWNDYFTVESHRQEVMGPLNTVDRREKYDIWVNVQGGGPTGQSGAVRLGLGRALTAAEPDLDHQLRGEGHLTRDGRMVERKKFGRRKARRSFQFSKR